MSNYWSLATFVHFVEGRKTPTSEGIRLPFHLWRKGSFCRTYLSLTLSFDNIYVRVYVRDTCYGARLRTSHDVSGVGQLDRVRKGEAPKRSGSRARRNPFSPLSLGSLPSCRNNRRYNLYTLPPCAVVITVQWAATLSIPLGHYVPKRYPTKREKMGHRITG